MTTIRKGNVILDVPEMKLAYYQSLGYNLIDDMQREIKPLDAKDLKIKELEKEITELKDNVENLTIQLKEVKTTKPKEKAENK